MRKIAILDLECTCDENKKDGAASKIKREEMEIIEIGVVISDLNGKVQDQLCLIVKPIINPILTEFCTNLTTITQEQVEKGISLIEALKITSDFMKKHEVDTWCSWGDFDRNQIKRECLLKKIDLNEFHISSLKHFNLSKGYMVQNGIVQKRRHGLGVGKALAREKLNFEGVKHRAIDDVINIARIVGSVNKNGIVWKI